MESKVLGRTITVKSEDAGKAHDIIIRFVGRDLASLQDEKYHADRTEFVICDCCEWMFRVICSDIIAEGIELL